MDRYFSERDYAVENGINIDKIILLDKKKLDDVFKIFIRQSEELYNRICEYFQLPKT